MVVPYWQHVLERPPQTLLDSLVQARDNGAEIVGLCLGSFVLGYAGILSGKRAATHWEFEHQFQTLFPDVRLDINALYVDDGNVITSAGTAAALDCCLYIIRQRFGSVVANQIARRMIVPPHREGGQAQFIAQPVPKDTRDGRINCLIDYLQQHILPIESVAEQVGFLSAVTYRQQFKARFGVSPAEWRKTFRVKPYAAKNNAGAME